MEEKRMLELADRLVELKESKAATEAQLSAINGDIEDVQAQLVAIMTEQECSGFKRGNKNFSLVVTALPSPVVECKAELWEVMKANGYMWLSAFAGHAYKFVKRLTKEERKNWGYAGIWEMNTVRANKDHPAMFPVELPWRCIKMHSDRGDIVVEPFSGSGTTIIACEQSERVCYAMERSPEYCDLAVKRWEEFTGQKAERIPANNGQEDE